MTKKYQILSDVYSDNGELTPIMLPASREEREIIRTFIYMRVAYPHNTTTLQCDGYIVSTAELSRLAAHLILDNYTATL